METISFELYYDRHIQTWFDFKYFLKRVFISSIYLRLWRFTFRISWSKLKDISGENSEENKRENIKILEKYLFGKTTIK